MIYYKLALILKLFYILLILENLLSFHFLKSHNYSNLKKPKILSKTKNTSFNQSLIPPP